MTAAQPAPPTVAVGSPRLLVVEDHPLFRDALVGVINSAFPGAEILQATSIDGALDVLAAHSAVDLVLLDLAMPETTGLLGAFRVRVAAPRSALVIVSAHENSRIIGGATALGIAGYIPKSTPRSVSPNAIWMQRRRRRRTLTRKTSSARSVSSPLSSCACSI
jgi:DNA-binding NarL/FixJ family response regulator